MPLHYRKWLVCGVRRRNSTDGTAHVQVWDAQTHEKALDIRGHTNTVFLVDISPDSTKLTAGLADKHVFIWSLMTGERLVGPLQHDNWAVAVRFSEW